MPPTDEPKHPDPAEATEIKPPLASPGGPRRDSRFTPGTMLADRFRIVALLGRGGMGEIYRAEDVKLGQQVALKFLPLSIAADAAKLERHYQEVRLGRQVSHPNVCRVYDVMEWEGQHFISMEYIDGEDLASLLRRIGKLPHDKALDIARDLCAGLAAAHSLGIVHRDLKPANVMIDGRGTARITDFGLAGFAEDLALHGEIAGTPAYMAPEQLSAGEITHRTDLYALGLILYEMFTGKRMFEAKSVGDIIAQHESARSHSLSQETREIDPAVQRVILRCLEERVESRPPSIHAVIAALPGGDPLQAAVDAGETPSPEMVAAAGESGELRPAVAWALLITIILLILLNSVMSQRTMLYGRVSLPKKPDVLAERAREILAKAGYTREPADVAYNLGWNNDYFESAGKKSENLDLVRPSPVVFYYRESPRELLALTSERRVSPIDPPLTVSHMANVELDAAGRLIRFVVVPPEAEEPDLQRKQVDWSPFVAESGIDAATLRSVAPKWRAPVDSEQKVAWEGRYAEQPGVIVRVEAASHHGRAVWFSVIPPWQEIDRREFAGAVPSSKVADVIGAIIGMVALVAATLLARRNLRRSRGDRKGAFRLAFFLFVLVLDTRALRVNHVWDIAEEGRIMGQLTSEALLTASVSWLLYLALEPYFRRRLPRMLIAWTRLLAGRFRDPMIGRDGLVGALAGCVCAILMKLSIVAPTWLGRPLSPVRVYFTALTELRQVAFLLLNNLQGAISAALTVAFLFLLFYIIFRSAVAATALLLAMSFVGFVASAGALAPSAAPVQIVFAVIASIVMVFVFRRYGLLALTFLCAFMLIMASAPLTLNPSVWYFGRSFFVMALMSGIAGYAFWISLADQPIFGLALLEED